MTKLVNPIPLFLDATGTLLDGGRIYVGVVAQDPESDPIQVYWDAARTIPAEQPLRTLGGVIVNGYSPAFVYFAEADYSLRVRDADGNQVSYVSSTAEVAGQTFQPLNSNLTAIAALATTTFGRNLLTLADAAGLRAAAAIAPALPLTGGIMTGAITRQGAGSHTYHVDASLTSGRIFVTAANAADPTTQPGDIWLKRSV